MLTCTEVLIFNYAVHVILLTHTVTFKINTTVASALRHSSKQKNSMKCKQWLRATNLRETFIKDDFPTLFFVNNDFLKEKLQARANEANMLAQHHPTLLAATRWLRLNTMLGDVG